jgi:hypothetical protein
MSKDFAVDEAKEGKGHWDVRAPPTVVDFKNPNLRYLSRLIRRSSSALPTLLILAAEWSFSMSRGAAVVQWARREPFFTADLVSCARLSAAPNRERFAPPNHQELNVA